MGKKSLLLLLISIAVVVSAAEETPLTRDIKRLFQNSAKQYGSHFVPPLRDDLKAAGEGGLHPLWQPPPFQESKRQASLPVDYIRIGFTSTRTFGSPQQIYAVRNDQVYFMFAAYVNNTLGGIVMNNTRYFIQLISFNDGADCELMNLLYTQLITVHKVHALLAPVTYNCETPSLIADQYGIPFINGADYTLPILMDMPGSGYTNLQYTRNVNANYWTSAEAIAKPIYAAGARTFMGFYNVEVPDYVPAMYKAAEALNMTIVQNITIVSLQDLATQQKNNPGDPCAGFSSFIDLVQARDPDFLYGTWSVNTTDFFTCMYRRQYRPRAVSGVTGIADLTDPNNAWKAFGALGATIWTGTTDSGSSVVDPIWGTVANFNTLYKQYWNVTGDLGYHATVASAPSLLLWSIQKANSLQPQAILAAMDTFNSTLLYGATRIIPGTRHFDHPYTGLQFINATHRNLIYPLGIPGTAAVIYPWKFVYPQAFLDSLRTSFFTANNIVWIAIICVVVFIGLVALGIFIVVRMRYNTVFIPKSHTNTEWGSAK